ncbi:NADH-quinone oxidoreductase subunit NuoE [soil metagenome]
MADLLQPGDVATRPRAPRIDEVELRFSPEAVHEIDRLKEHYPTLKSVILPALWLAQREYGGFLSAGAIAEVAYRLKRAYAEVEGVATFYSLYNAVHEPGRHKLELCTCLTCHVNGTWEVRDHIKRRLGIRHGETTPDGMFTLEEVECLNACDRAPVMQVGDQYFGPLTIESTDALLDQLAATEASTVVQYADSVVKVHIRDTERYQES